MIIAVSGYAGSGKDTVGKIIQYILCGNVGDVSLEEVIADKEGHHDWWLAEQSGWQVKKWAGKLKKIASLLTGIPVEKFEDQEFKKTYLGSEWSTLKMKPGKRQDGIFSKKVDMELVPMTVRQFLQELGTDGLRNGLHPNVWVNALMADYKGQKVCDCPEEFKCRCIYRYPNWIITDTRFPNEAQAIKNKGGIVIRVDRPGVTAVNAHESETALDGWDFDYKIANVSDIQALAFTVDTILKEQKIYANN